MKKYLRLAAIAVTAVMFLGALASCGEIKIPEFVDDMMNFEYDILELETTKKPGKPSAKDEESEYGSYESEPWYTPVESEYESEKDPWDDPWKDPWETESDYEPEESESKYEPEESESKYEPEESESDPTEDAEYRERILLVTDFHYVKDWYGVDDDERMARMVEHINDEHKKDPLTMIIFMGDYSLDHWAWDNKNNPVTYLNTGKIHTQIFMDKYKSQLPDVPMFWLAGNHEQFGEANWKKITGNARQGYAVIEDYLIVMWDSFGAELDPYYHHDGVYSPMNTAWVSGLMDKYPDKKVILVSHYFNASKELENSAELISDDRVVALFVGHDHHSAVTELDAAFGYKKLIFAGNYSYYNSKAGDPYPYYWGFRDLELEHGVVRSEYIIPENTITVNGETVNVGPTTQDGWSHRVVW